jgi:hypothetical protein
VLFQLLIPGLTSVTLLESKLGLEIVLQLADTGKIPFSHLLSMVCAPGRFSDEKSAEGLLIFLVRENN